MTSIAELLREAKQRLTPAVESAALEAAILLAYVLKKSREFLLTWPEKNIDTQQAAIFFSLIERRKNGEPIAYITGQRAFWDFDLHVTPDVLIPRHDTELLVELSIEKLPQSPITIADLGTGSGAIAFALARMCPQWQVLAVDVSDKACKVAELNRQTLNIENTQVIQSTWCDAFQANCLDAIISNPPYIAADDEHILQGDLRFEPHTALIAAQNGLADLYYIIAQAKTCLKPKAWLLLEHGWQQGPDVRRYLVDAGYQSVETCRDLAGQERVSMGQWP